MNQQLSQGASALLKKLNQFGVGTPHFHIVLGSGFKDALVHGLPRSFQVKADRANKAHISRGPCSVLGDSRSNLSFRSVVVVELADWSTDARTLPHRFFEPLGRTSPGLR